MKFDIEGRIRNMRLPDGRTALLYSIYEAVMNGVQAIEERLTEADDASPGRMFVNVSKNTSKAIEDVIVYDNGVGLNKRHLDSFNVCDTRQKADIGGRGVGRLVWLKAFDRIEVTSTFRDEKRLASLSFVFDPEQEDSRTGLATSDAKEKAQGTTITLKGAKEEDKKLSMALLSRSLCHHFFPFLLPAVCCSSSSAWRSARSMLDSI